MARFLGWEFKRKSRKQHGDYCTETSDANFYLFGIRFGSSQVYQTYQGNCKN